MMVTKGFYNSKGKGLNNEQSKESGILYAVFTTVLLYFLFKITLIFSMQLNWHSTCLSSLWGNANSVVTPFLGFSIVAVLSCIWFFYCAIKYKQKAGKAVYLLLGVGAVFYYFWFRGFYGFWQLMSYEQKEITVQEFYEKTGGTDRLTSMFGNRLRHHELCKSPHD
ncbi:hypothetical protein J8Z28_21455 [Pseudoalteromonas sp. SCSIO 43088]|uniref:hypothetical protein n=1 Tax=Pseudoalteromonas sp. SCSIO 43088 TaxID=2822846 RepID=UPI00202ADC90|nr:hypothetical protein [Pseudoalteromonas sp. SCSIO 43088]URQ88454.1 hypothetical protein J8Z28_21455 [Pseudoalteromonas sp. SCSIO 43088]